MNGDSFLKERRWFNVFFIRKKMNLYSVLPSFPCLEVEEDGEKIVFYRVMMVNFTCQTYWTKKYPDNSMSLSVPSRI